MISAHIEILSLIAMLGGNTRQYRRERSAQINRILSEVYSTPRVTRAAELLPHYKIIPGSTFDVTGCDENGDSWDFNRQVMREKALKVVEEEEPYLLIGSPPCTNICRWVHLFAARYGWSEEEKQKRRAAAEVHLKFVHELYSIQIRKGRYFLHEHPEGSESWKNPYILDLWNQESVDRIVGDQCQYGQHDGDGNPVKKATGWLSNSKHILRALGRRCQGRGGACSRPGGRQVHSRRRTRGPRGGGVPVQTLQSYPQRHVSSMGARR